MSHFAGMGEGSGVKTNQSMVFIVFVGWFSLIQRTALVPFMVWIFLFVWGHIRQTRPAG